MKSIVSSYIFDNQAYAHNFADLGSLGKHCKAAFLGVALLVFLSGAERRGWARIVLIV